MKQYSNLNLLKIVAILFVIGQHTISSFWYKNLGLTSAIYPIFFNNNTLFALLTGYFLINGNTLRSKYLQIVLYGLPLLLIHGLGGMNYSLPPSLAFQNFIQTTFDDSWYYYSIIIVYVLAPFIAHFYQTNKNGKYWVTTLFIVFTTIIVLTNILTKINSSFKLSFMPKMSYAGYFTDMSFVKLFIWFQVGAMLKIYNLTDYTNYKWWKLSTYLLLIPICYVLSHYSFTTGKSNFEKICAAFNLVITTLFSVALFGLFAAAPFNCHFIDVVAETTLVTYLLHKLQIYWLAKYWTGTFDLRNIVSLILIPVGFVFWSGVGYLYNQTIGKQITKLVRGWDNKFLVKI
ncbi:acyltransferase family protein [Spiroplasma sp. DGKH1]|uniref:acyltransferase family protein n=1 Tax=Spiroplasma sp. DGKH1 TaxID=3050074 RepID=UPI0034C6B052